MTLANWMRTTGRSRRRFFADATAMSAVLLTAAGCASQNEVVVTETTTPGRVVPSAQVTVPGAGVAGTGAATTSAASTLKIVSSPKFGTKDIAPTAAVTVTAFNAKITELTVTGADGGALKGDLDAGGGTWTLGERMKYNQTYTFAGTATDTDGTATPISGDLTTVNPSSTTVATFVVEEGGTYGVGQPVVIVFNGPVTDKAAAQTALKLTTDKGDIVGSWGWLQDEDILANGVLKSQVHFRPKDYWPANTSITVEAKLYGVDYGNGGWGADDVTRTFTIGRKLEVIADVNSFRLKVNVNDVQVKDYPVSYGKATDLRRQTRSGTHVVQAKYPDFDMCNSQFSYCGVKVLWAVRINNNGEFIHENDSTIKYQGVANVSHGCVNMSTANAKDFYDLCFIGDPVVVSGTDVQLSASDYIYDWAYSYDTWKSFSAL